jgi:hypothetical protein|tara:strand:- start:61 stop:1065 length:1005 start_codon:yes stop_codon:yes gene_type:complete
MKLEEIVNIQLLANHLKIEKESLQFIVNNDYITEITSKKDFKKGCLINEIKIKKRSNGYRYVYSPVSDILVNTLKILSGKIKELYKPTEYVHGFVPGRNTKTNAQEHLAKRVVYCVDIDKYFENIDIEKVKSAILSIGYNEYCSDKISKIVTHKNQLVQGFHTSPVIANIVFHEIDLKLSRLGDENVSYTRYADDLYFSTSGRINFEKDIEDILNSYGFKVNSKKTKFMIRGRSQFVTGLTVFDEMYPRIPKKIKRSIRQKIHFISLFGYRGHVLHKLNIEKQLYDQNEEIQKHVDSKIYLEKLNIEGWLNYINSIEPDFSKKCYSKLSKKDNP